MCASWTYQAGTVCEDNSTKGSVLLTQLLRESAKEFSQDYYSKNSNKQLKDLQNTFTAFVPDNYEQVRAVSANDLLLA